MVSQTLWIVYFPCRRRKTKEKNHETDKPEIKTKYPVANLSVSKREVRPESSIKTCFLVEIILQNNNLLGIGKTVHKVALNRPQHILPA